MTWADGKQLVIKSGTKHVLSLFHQCVLYMVPVKFNIIKAKGKQLWTLITLVVLTFTEHVPG